MKKEHKMYNVSYKKYLNGKFSCMEQQYIIATDMNDIPRELKQLDDVARGITVDCFNYYILPSTV